MIKAAVAVPLWAMEKFGEGWANDGDKIIISIIDPDQPVIFEEDTDDIITLKFHDISPAPCVKFLSCESSIPCTTEHAIKMVKFLMKHHRSDVTKKLICNCTAGICRSGAVVQFAQLICGIDEKTFREGNPSIIPNMWVSDIMSSVFLNRQQYDNIPFIF